MPYVLLGLVPALQRTRPDVASALRSESAGDRQPGQLQWRNALFVTQLTISLALLVGAELLPRSLRRVQSVDPGFGREPTALLTFLTPETRFPPDEARVYTRRLLRSLPCAPQRRGGRRHQKPAPELAQPELERGSGKMKRDPVAI